MGSKCSANSLSQRSPRLTNELKATGLETELCQHIRENAAVRGLEQRAGRGKHLRSLPAWDLLKYLLCWRLCWMSEGYSAPATPPVPQEVTLIGILAAAPMDPTKTSVLHHQCWIQDLSCTFHVFILLLWKNFLIFLGAFRGTSSSPRQ